MMARVQSQMTKEDYKVTNYYWKTGYAQWIARSAIFDNLTLSIIGMNSIWIAIDMDYNSSETLFEAEPVFIVVENFFCGPSCNIGLHQV
jgi:hypothetical protein